MKVRGQSEMAIADAYVSVVGGMKALRVPCHGYSEGASNTDIAYGTLQALVWLGGQESPDAWANFLREALEEVIDNHGAFSAEWGQ